LNDQCDEKVETKRKTMSRIQTNIPAPDFTLADFRGRPVSLSEFRGDKNVLVVFNRGFA